MHVQPLSDAGSTGLRGHGGCPHPEQAQRVAAPLEPSSGGTLTAGYNHGQTQAMPPAHPPWDVPGSTPPRDPAGDPQGSLHGLVQPAGQLRTSTWGWGTGHCTAYLMSRNDALLALLVVHCTVVSRPCAHRSCTHRDHGAGVWGVHGHGQLHAEHQLLPDPGGGKQETSLRDTGLQEGTQAVSILLRLFLAVHMAWRDTGLGLSD